MKEGKKEKSCISVCVFMQSSRYYGLEVGKEA